MFYETQKKIVSLRGAIFRLMLPTIGGLVLTKGTENGRERQRGGESFEHLDNHILFFLPFSP